MEERLIENEALPDAGALIASTRVEGNYKGAVKWKRVLGSAHLSTPLDHQPAKRSFRG
jgi:hypothetical protein